jgi:glucose/mannose-6-phosphate isomerase
MLDDQNYIHQKDPQDFLGLLLNAVSQLSERFSVAGGALPTRQSIHTVVLCGMGGSALAAEYMKVWPGMDIPFEICRAYDLPKFVNENTLVIASSYSGNTEETLSTLQQAEERRAHIAVIASGGKLLEGAKEKNYPYIQIPGGEQPRACVFYNMKALTILLEGSGILNGAVAELEATAQKLQHTTDAWGPTIPTKENSAKKLAEEIVGKTPVIYGGILYAAAYKWKINANENAKNLAFCNQYPEFNHNEFVGWTSHPIEKPFVVFDLISSFDHPQVQKRFTISDRLLSGMRPEAIEIQAEGDSLIEQLLWVTMLGDIVTTYLAVLNGVNPTPVDLPEKLKIELRA